MEMRYQMVIRHQMVKSRWDQQEQHNELGNVGLRHSVRGLKKDSG